MDRVIISRDLVIGRPKASNSYDGYDAQITPQGVYLAASPGEPVVLFFPMSLVLYVQFGVENASKD